MQDFPVKLIGLYAVHENPDVSLVELLINKKADEFSLTDFTQEEETRPRDSWQAPFNERYLSLDGETIIGDDFDLPEILSDTTRLTFFIYFLDPSKPLVTPFGNLKLTQKQEPPERIKRLVKFEDPE